jgi:hypothetical protein
MAENEEAPSSARGDAAWKEKLDRVAERNKEAKKSGRRQREEYEAKGEKHRRDLERQREAIFQRGRSGGARRTGR